MSVLSEGGNAFLFRDPRNFGSLLLKVEGIFAL